MVLLAAGAISIVGAAAREAALEPGRQPDAALRHKAWRSMFVATVCVAAVLYGGNQWWNAEADNYARIIYKPLEMEPVLRPGGILELRLKDPGWLPRGLDDFVPDHGHLMHLFVIRLPEMERIWHLHPEMTAGGVFTQHLPPMPAGRYALYGDVVHENGLPETLAAEVDLPQIAGKPLSGDDSAAEFIPLSQADFTRRVAPLAGGGRMIWERRLDVYPVKKPHALQFRVETDEGKPASDLELYMGMPGHAVFVRHDRSVFAHVHPNGSVPMAALAITQQAAGDPHAGHAMSLPAEISFPYGFPQPGSYRVFVQVRQGGQVRTGAFDVKVN